MAAPTSCLQLDHLLVATVPAPGVILIDYGPLEVRFPFWALPLLQASSYPSCPSDSGGFVTLSPLHEERPTVHLTNMGFGKVGYSNLISETFIIFIMLHML